MLYHTAGARRISSIASAFLGELKNVFKGIGPNVF